MKARYTQLIQPTLLCSLILSGAAYASAAEIDMVNADSNRLWNLVVIIIVLMVAAGSAVLPLAAIRQWSGGWRTVAALPLLGLLIWVAVIALAKMASADAHALWPFEIFAWAMLCMIYMVTAMTAKRMFEKKDLQDAEQDGDKD